jgi:hypothetical protein
MELSARTVFALAPDSPETFCLAVALTYNFT